MILCLCKAVNDRVVRESIDRGARTVTSVGQACGAGTDCGSCCADIRSLLRERTGPVRQDRAAAAK